MSSGEPRVDEASSSLSAGALERCAHTSSRCAAADTPAALGCPGDDILAHPSKALLRIKRKLDSTRGLVFFALLGLAPERAGAFERAAQSFSGAADRLPPSSTRAQ